MTDPLIKELDALLKRLRVHDDDALIEEAADIIESLRERLQRAEAEIERLRYWLDNNTTFYDVDADWPVEGHNIPVLAQVSNRIWYHATDDMTSYPFSKVIDAYTEPFADAALGESHG